MTIRALFVLPVLALSLGACGGGKLTPDEFEVVGRAPLVVPPVSTLAPPRPGEPRAQEINPGRVAFEALFPGAEYDRDGLKSDGERLLLSGLRGSDPDIRSNFADEELDVVKKRLLLAEILNAEERTYRPDNVTIKKGTPGADPE